ncbi:YncE family protein [Pedobacter sp. SD-b]|uniref:YncE family protein n=1 Tax=Pedobacter segetis TaxID=2793069 RepID=A0ABS1BI38_9SPHI|nr:YncE family protein [Pedobacter segetis]MBK0382482.1 YncE family protein [Pedobacter segetis]
MKTNKTIFKLLAFAIAASTIFSCKKDENTALPPVRAGLYILNEGGFQSNNASLSYYNLDTKTTTANYFAQKNKRGLGDTGNDIKVYGSKMYIVVSTSNTLEVVNPKTSESIKQIGFTNKGVGRLPRNIVFNKNKAFVSSYDGTVAVIDTSSLAVEKFIAVGRNPEQMAIANNKLYVANSGGLDPVFDNTISVIDLNSLVEVKKITTVSNPTELVSDASSGKIYIRSPGDYDQQLASLTIIDSKTDAVISNKPFEGKLMKIVDNIGYFVFNNGIKSYDLKSDAVLKSNIITDGTTFSYAYGFNYDAVNKDFFVCDAKNFIGNGEVSCIGLDGKLKYKIIAGVNPNNVIFLNK